MIRGNAQSGCQPQKRGGMHRVDSCRNKDGQSVGSNENTAVECPTRTHRFQPARPHTKGAARSLRVRPCSIASIALCVVQYEPPRFLGT